MRVRSEAATASTVETRSMANFAFMRGGAVDGRSALGRARRYAPGRARRA